MLKTILFAFVFNLSTGLVLTGCSNASPEDPAKAAIEAFNKKSPVEKFEWARDVEGMSPAMRLKQIDLIDGALDGQKQAWKDEILKKYKNVPMGGPDYQRG